MYDPRRFVPILDAVDGRFDSFVESSQCPAPLPLSNASSLDAYMRSFYVEIFDWDGALSHPASGFPRPANLPDVDATPVTDATRSQGWTLRVQARLAPGAAPNLAIGFAVNPRVTRNRLYRWTYLLLSPSCRREPWTIIKSESKEVLDWRDNTPVDDGDYHIQLRDDVMLVDFHRSPTLFAARVEAARSLSSTQSSGSGKKAKRGGTPKMLVRQRDQYCLISGSDLSRGSFLGEPKVAHILPLSQAWLADELRAVLDPMRGQASDNQGGWRWHVPNHPSNLMILASVVEDRFDNFGVGIDVLSSGSPTVHCFDRYAAGPPNDREVSRIRTEGYHFPPLPFAAAGVPGPSSCFLLVHLMSILATTCRLRMTDESEPDRINDGLEDEDDEESLEFPRCAPITHSGKIEGWLLDLPDCPNDFATEPLDESFDLDLSDSFFVDLYR